MYHHRTSLGPVELAFTDRHGGVSAAPFDSLNLALGGGDPEESRAANVRLLLEDFAPHDVLGDLDQVHGNRVVTASGSSRSCADAIVTVETGVVLMIRVADCVPVLLADPDAGVVGAVHSGRPGLAARVVPAAVSRMRELGAQEVTAWIGPHVCGACYEVPAGMQAEVGALEPASVATTSWGTPSLDLGAGVRAQLEREGVTVVDVSCCTRESPDPFSHRRDGGAAGRLAGVIRLVTR
ncbi:MAG: laccase domain-containing protein [Cellulomonas sp.]|nr:laccase domain-containing protein [Cellulomonas sp.]